MIATHTADIKQDMNTVSLIADTMRHEGYWVNIVKRLVWVVKVNWNHVCFVYCAWQLLSFHSSSGIRQVRKTKVKARRSFWSERSVSGTQLLQPTHTLVYFCPLCFSPDLHVVCLSWCLEDLAGLSLESLWGTFPQVSKPLSARLITTWVFVIF